MPPASSASASQDPVLDEIMEPISPLQPVPAMSGGFLLRPIGADRRRTGGTDGKTAAY
jgi:hypothetical protein